MAKKKIDSRVKTYTNSKGEKKFMFQLYLGVDPLTGKKKRTTRRNFSTALAADRALKRLEFEVQDNGVSSISETKKDKKFKEVYETWFSNYQKTVKESTWASTKLIFRVHILPLIGDNFIGKMDVLYCQKIVDKWADESPKLFKKYKNYAANVFDYAISIQLINSNPMRIVSIPKGEALKIEKKDVDFYSREELIEFLRFVESFDYRLYTFFFLLAYTGLRKGEALALYWSDVDFKSKTLDITKTVTRGEKGRILINKPKTKNGIRKIFLDDGLVTTLRKFKKNSSNIISITNQDQLIFETYGHAYNPTVTKFWLQQIYKANPNLKVITAHGFRHTHASLLFESGASLKDAQEILGHSDIQTTANIYTHVTENKTKTTISNFSKFMQSSQG